MREITNSLFIIGDAPKGSYAALPEKAGGRAFTGILHAIADRQESFTVATRRLICLADLAYGQRDYDALRELSAALSAIPFQPAQRAGQYYVALLHTRAGQLDRAAELLAPLHAPRALLTLGTVEEYRGNFTEAARLHVEAMRAGRGVDLFTVAGAQMQLATIRAVEGDHGGALYNLQSAGPLVRLAAASQPALYAIWHNSLAVELCELGYRDEARQAIAIALASPIADRYPEFEATGAEIAEKQPARIAVAVVSPQEDAETTEARPDFSAIVDGNSPPRFYLITIQPYTRALNPRASPRAPPSSFVVRS